MATTYHISSTGEARVCRATKGQCPLARAGSEHHQFATAEEARRWAEDITRREQGGSFGNLAKKLAERTIAENQAHEELQNKTEAEEEWAALKAAARANDELFSRAAFEELNASKGLKRRKKEKEFQEASKQLGYGPQAHLYAIYTTYLKTFDVKELDDEKTRALVRDRLVMGKLVAVNSQKDYNGYGGSANLRAELTRLEEGLNSIDFSAKPELQNEQAPDIEGIKELSTEDLTRELALAQEREGYLAQWRGEAKARLVNYGADSGRLNKHGKELFGEHYVAIVHDGPVNGFTREEADWFEEQQPKRWDAYHNTLEAEAFARLNQ